MKFEEIEKYYLQTISEAEAILSWYPKKRISFRMYSQLIRLGTVVLAGLGGIMPLLELAFQGNEDMRLVNYGYVAFSVAASLFLLDKYFGFSTGWMRFMLAEVEIKKVISEKKNEWIYYQITYRGKELTKEEIRTILDFNNSLSNAVNNLVIKETKEWINEFKSTYKSLEELTNSGRNNSTISNNANTTPMNPTSNTPTAGDPP